jgi:hypothetical protein
MGPIRNPNWSTSGMRVTLSYLTFNEHAQYSAQTRHSSTVCTVQRVSCVFAQILASSAQMADTRFGGVVPMSKENAYHISITWGFHVCYDKYKSHDYESPCKTYKISFRQTHLCMAPI